MTPGRRRLAAVQTRRRIGSARPRNLHSYQARSRTQTIRKPDEPDYTLRSTPCQEKLGKSVLSDHSCHMTSVSISDLKARLSAFIDIVRHGDEVLVTDQGRPVARLVPARDDEQEDGQREILIRSGRLRAPSATSVPDFWTRSRALDADGRALDALLEERDSGR